MSESLGRAPVWLAYADGISEPAFRGAAIMVVAVHCAVSTVMAWGVDQLVGKRCVR